MKVGVLCGIEREAAIVRGALQNRDHEIICTGARAENAANGAARLAAGGATHLVSFGLAGALHDNLKPGDLMLPARVIDAEGQDWTPDAAWRERICRGHIAAHDAPLLGLDHPARTGAQKLFLSATLDAASVDMESHFIARAAEAAGVPFVVVRAIADDSRTTLPNAAMEAVSPEGRELPLNAAKALIRRPGEIGALMRLGLASGKGFRTLGRVARLGLGF